MTQVQRKYILTKVDKGDYLLPSNDGQKIWRLHVYVDGTVAGLENGPREVNYWAVSKWTGRANDQVGIANSIVEGTWDLWEWQAGSLRTRAEAIAEAMRLGTPLDTVGSP